jgi:hypothetical protein
MLKGSPTGFENLPEYQYFNGSDSSFGTALAASQIDTVHSGDDLLIGEPASGNGQVYLVKSSASGWLTNYNSGALGSPTLMNVTNLFAKGQYLGDQFGYSIAVNGKMNTNSLINTVAIGAPQNFIAGPKAGRVYPRYDTSDVFCDPPAPGSAVCRLSRQPVGRVRAVLLKNSLSTSSAWALVIGTIPPPRCRRAGRAPAQAGRTAPGW